MLRGSQHALRSSMSKIRNFALHITPAQKQALKRLADNSGMTLTKYVEEVLNDAVKDRSLFKVTTQRVSPAEKGKIAARV
jgi:predicted DNA-binding protein